MNISQKSKLSEEEVLLAFSVEPDHQHQTLERYLNTYPEYSLALVDLSIELKVLNSGDLENSGALNVSVDKEWQLFNNIVEQTRNDKLADPLTTATREQFKEIAKALKVNTLFLSRLRDKQIELSTIPNQFIERLAACLEVSVEIVKSFLNSNPTISSAVSFKAEGTPETTNKISFEKAIETSSLTDEQLNELKSLI